MKVTIIKGQKREVKINSMDLWEGDKTLSYVIYPFLKKYRALYNGKNPMTAYPACFEDDDEKGLQAWIDALDKMIFSFEVIVKNKENPYTAFPEYWTRKKQILKKYKLSVINSIGKNFPELDELYEEMRPKFEKYENAINEGLMLFGKYFRSLWT